MFKFKIVLLISALAIALTAPAFIPAHNAQENKTREANSSHCIYDAPSKVKSHTTRFNGDTFNAKSLGTISHLSSGWTLADPETRQPILDEDGDQYFFRQYGTAFDTLETMQTDGTIVRAYTVH